MRVLFTHQPGFGHWHPLVPLAQALEAAGHEVAFATVPTFCPKVEANGFRCFPVGAAETDEELRQRGEQQASLTPEQRAAFMWTNVFAGVRAERSLLDMLAVAREWQPAVIVRDLTEFAGLIAAESLGIPHATLQVAVYRPQLHSLILAPLNRLRETVGGLSFAQFLEPIPPQQDPDLPHRYLMLSPRPPSFQDPATPLPPTSHAIRHVGFNASTEEQLPTWVAELPEIGWRPTPTVYATLGTVFNHLNGIFSAILEGLRDEPINLILTVGHNQSPADFGAQPPNVHIEQYIPQSLLLPHCDLIITHGGSGTVMDALSHGLPMVIIPIAADQPPNAQSCARLGVARVIQPDQRTPEAIREATRDVLQNPNYRQNAQRIRDEMQALPGWEYAVELLERLATEKAPILSSQA